MIAAPKVYVILVAITLLQITPENASFTSINPYVDFKFKEVERVLAKIHSQYATNVRKPAENSDEVEDRSVDDSDYSTESPLAVDYVLTRASRDEIRRQLESVIELVKLSTVPKNTTEPPPLELANLILDENYKQPIKFNDRQARSIRSIQSSAEELERCVKKYFDPSKTTFAFENVLLVSDKISVGNSANFQNLFVNALQVKYWNQQEFEVDKIVIPNVSQAFSYPLSAKDIYIDNLEIPSLCGLKHEDWLGTDDAHKTSLVNVDSKNAVIHNDTVFIHQSTAFFVQELNTNKVNNLSTKSMMDDLFVIGKKQVIEDADSIVFEGLVHVKDLNVIEINDAPASTFITKHTNQSLDEVYIDKLEATKIFVETVNGVSINEAARKSRTNVIKGRITIKNLAISGELVIKDSIVLPLSHPTQVYEDVMIEGNLFVRNVELLSSRFGKSLVLLDENDVPATFNVPDMMKNSWSRSGYQIVASPVVLEKGASIDYLSCLAINDLRLADVVPVNSTEIASSSNNDSPLIFENFHFNDFVANHDSDGSSAKLRFIDDSAVNVLTINKPIRWRHVSVINIHTETYNGIPLKVILDDEKSFPKFLGSAEFETVRVSNLMAVDYLRVQRFNQNTNVSLDKVLTVSRDLQLNELLNLRSLNVKSLVVDKLLGENVEEALKAQSRIATASASEGLASLTVNGNVVVQEHLQASKINGEEVDAFVSDLKFFSLEDLIDTKGVKKHLHVLGNLNSTYLNARNVRHLFSNVLTKSSRQVNFKALQFANVNVNYLKTNRINEKSVDNIGFVDKPCVFYADATFSELFVRGKIESGTIKNERTSELKSRLQTIAVLNLTSLAVIGNVFWNNCSPNAHSIGQLLRNAVTKHEYQKLRSPVIFQNPVILHHLHLEHSGSSFAYQQVDRIVSDAVVDRLGSISVLNAAKVFKNRFDADSIEVTDSVNIENINGFAVNDVIGKIFKLDVRTGDDSGEPADGRAIVFLKEVEIGNLVSSDKIHDVASHQLYSYRQAVPEEVHFEKLIVQSNVTLDKLDGIHFNSFKENRLTTYGDSEVLADVEFARTVFVLDNQSSVSLVNNIATTDIVGGVDEKDDTANVPILISGRKTFDSEELTVLGNIETTQLNDFQLQPRGNQDCTVEDSVDREIFGDLAFQAGVEIFGHVNVSGRLNGEEQSNVSQVESVDQLSSSATKTLKKVESSLSDTLALWNSRSRSPSLPVFHYLEQNDNLLPQQLRSAGVLSVKSTRMGPKTRLDVYVTGNAASCGSPDRPNCVSTCSTLYTLEMTSTNDSTIRLLLDGPTPSFKVLTLSSLFEVEISSEQCLSGQNYGFTRSRVVLRKTVDGEKSQLLEFEGLVVADAQIFNVDDRTYLLMAVFYNEKTKSHSTASLLCEIRAQDRSANVIQYIKTDGAKTIHIFELKNLGVHALIGCVKGKAESHILRFISENCQFQPVRAFATGGSKYVSSISSNNETFVVLNNPDIEALQIFKYNSDFDNFYDYQNLFFESKITGLSVFNGDSRYDDAFIVATTKDGWLYIYEYMLYGKFQLTVSHWVEDIQVLAPFSHSNRNYLFSGTKSNNTIFVIIQQDFI